MGINRKTVSLIGISVLIAIFSYLWVRYRQVSIDNCYITLPEDEIKTISATELLKSPRELVALNNISVDQFKQLAQWEIIIREPTPRREAASEYDMTLYEVRLVIDETEYSVFIEKCRNIIAAGR